MWETDEDKDGVIGGSLGPFTTAFEFIAYQATISQDRHPTMAAGARLRFLNDSMIVAIVSFVWIELWLAATWLGAGGWKEEGTRNGQIDKIY